MTCYFTQAESFHLELENFWNVVSLEHSFRCLNSEYQLCSVCPQDNIVIVKDDMNHPMSIVSSTKSRWVQLFISVLLLLWALHLCWRLGTRHSAAHLACTVGGGGSGLLLCNQPMKLPFPLIDWPYSTEMATSWTTWASPSSTTSCRVSSTLTPLDRRPPSACHTPKLGKQKWGVGPPQPSSTKQLPILKLPYVSSVWSFLVEFDTRSIPVPPSMSCDFTFREGGGRMCFLFPFFRSTFRDAWLSMLSVLTPLLYQGSVEP